MSLPMDPRCLQDEMEVWNRVAFTSVLPLLSVFGIIGEIFVLLTIHYGKLKDSPYVYLQCIALTDLLLLVATIGDSAHRWVLGSLSLNAVLQLKRYYWYFSTVLSQQLRNWLTLLTLSMTIERFIYVRWPMKTRSLCTRERAKKACLTLFFVAWCSPIATGWQLSFDVVEQKSFQPHHSVRYTGKFQCSPNVDEIDSASQFICYNKKFPLSVQSDSTNGTCSTTSSKPSSASPSKECLHRSCELPTIPKNSTFESLNFSGTHIMLRYDIMGNARIFRLTTKIIPLEQLSGRALFINETCFFILVPVEVEPAFPTINNVLFAPFVETIECVGRRVSPSWQWRARSVYLRVWEAVYMFCTGVLTVFNVLIVIQVRKANRKAQDEVLSNNEQSLATRRRSDEHRLTMSLLALSTVKMFSDIVYFTAHANIAVLFYDQVYPPGFSLKVHLLLSEAIYVLEYTTYFYLLAFINRKFKREFLQKVVHGKLRIRGLPRSFLSFFTSSSRSTPAQRNKKVAGKESQPIEMRESGKQSEEADAESGHRAP